MPALLLPFLLLAGDGTPVESPIPAAPAPLHDPTDVSGCCVEGEPLPWPLYNRGVVWTEDLLEARRRALAEGKLVMVFRLVGDLDRGGT
jgi:hypothetical protein